MSTQMNELPDRRKSEPSKFTQLLWWFSTAIPELIKDCTSDRYRAKIIGAGVVFTWLYATVAWIYFWSLNVSSPYIFVPLGILIGFGILSIDRMLIASISKKKKSIIAISFRVILAILLGSFIAQPILLWMFEKDISTEISIVQDGKVQEKRKELQSIYQSEKDFLLQRKAAINSEENTRYAALEKAEGEYIKEIDGTGGSEKFGIAGIAREKEKVMERAEESFKALKINNQKELSLTENRLLSIDSTIIAETQDFKENKLSEGFLIRVDALQSLFEKDEHYALQKRYYLILIILVLFELIPIISKLYLPTGSYDERLRLQDEMELNMAEYNQEQSLELKKYFNDVAQDSDKYLATELYKKLPDHRDEKIDELMQEWKASPTQSFNSFLENAKFKMIGEREG